MSNIQIIKQTILNLQTKGYTNYNTEKMGLCFYKPNQNDFVLWKNKKDKITWNSKWGYGRPGWHIECASLICKLLQSNNTRELDFHLGGLDLKPIHHKNQELILNSLNYKVKNWIHISELRKDGKKMSKSLGNTLYLQDLKDFSPYVIRYLFLSSNPEDIINFNSELLENKRSELRKISVLIANFLVNSYQDISKLDSQNIGIWNFKSGDYIQEFINYKNITFKQVLRVYCFNKLSNILPSRVFKIPNQVIDLFHKRIKVRQKNNFLESDKIRETIKTWKYNIQDMNNISLLIPLI
jgi:cysteinyl-tRNA synthetase